jgi:membrane protein YqaA with SNARE-associated domain
MRELFTRLTDWVVDFAESDWAILILAANSFTESIFFPVPPDLLLIGIAVLDPDRALWLAGIVTVSSVAGAVVGHWLGRRFGRPLLHRLVAESKILTVERMFQKYGAWAVLVAAFTPIPYKVFAIAAGALDLDRRRFVLASLVGRGARFFAIGLLIFAFGEDIEDFIGDNFGLLTIAAAAVLLVGLGIVALIARRRRAGDTVA